MGGEAVDKDPSDGDLSSNYWNGNCYDNGYVFGMDRSPTAQAFLTCFNEGLINENSRVMDTAAGYLRDSLFYAQLGHSVTAIDPSTKAITLAMDKEEIRALVEDKEKIKVLTSGFQNNGFAKEGFEVFACNRFIQSLVNPNMKEIFNNHAFSSVRTEGLILIGARSVDDFDSDVMEFVDKSAGIIKYKDGTEEFKGREDQRFVLYNEDRFEKEFDKSNSRIKILDFHKASEPERINHDRETSVLVMIAEKLPKKEIGIDGGGQVRRLGGSSSRMMKTRGHQEYAAALELQM